MPHPRRTAGQPLCRPEAAVLSPAAAVPSSAAAPGRLGAPTSAFSAVFLLALALSLAAVTNPLAAQAHPTAVAPEAIRHIQSISPQSGPPGTVVSVSSLNLPYEARVHVGVGAMGQGFEALAEAQQGRLGEIAVRVEVPDDVPMDRPIVFIAFNAIFAPIGMSDPFHVTDAEGGVRRSGEVVSTDDGCVVFQDQDGYDYELTGEVDGLAVGDEIRVEGIFFNTGPCTDGPTIGVSAVRR